MIKTAERQGMRHEKPVSPRNFTISNRQIINIRPGEDFIVCKMVSPIVTLICHLVFAVRTDGSQVSDHGGCLRGGYRILLRAYAPYGIPGKTVLSAGYRPASFFSVFFLVIQRNIFFIPGCHGDGPFAEETDPFPAAPVSLRSGSAGSRGFVYQFHYSDTRHRDDRCYG